MVRSHHHACGLPALVLALTVAAAESAELAVLRETIVDPAALNFSDAARSFSANINGRTFQRHPLTTFRQHQYAAYFDGNRNVCVGRRHLPDGPWEVIRFDDYAMSGSDSHNVVTLGICHQDGTIHLAFDHHADPLNYRVSVVGAATNPESVSWSTSLFGPVVDTLGSVGPLTQVTYPAFFNAPNGNLMLYYRFGGSGNGDGMIHEYDGATHDWTPGMGRFIARTGSYSGVLSPSSSSRNPYLNGISFAGDRLHVSWGWRESSGGAQYNHDLNYAYSDDHGRTWFNSSGTLIGTTGSSPLSIDSPGLLAAPIPQNSGLSNDYTHYAYPDGSCHVIVSHNEAGTTTRVYHHYWRDASGIWSSEALPFSGTRPKLVGDDDRSLFLAHASGERPRVAKGVPNATGTGWDWTVIHTQTNTSEGGEGLVDYSRWKNERILSYYGQKKPNADGDPTPLHVFDYQVSAKAILPIPHHGQTSVAESPTLEWTAGIDAVTHQVFLGTDEGAVAQATPSSPEFLGEWPESRLIPAAPLDELTTYYWRVDERDVVGRLHRGLIWSFTTIGNLPPSIAPITDRTVPGGTLRIDVPLVVGDDLTSPGQLILTISSSNTNLLPPSGVAVVDSDPYPTLRLSPQPGETGSSLVTVGVDDGTHLVEASFTLTVTGPTYQLFSLPEDASIRELPDVVDIDDATTLLGTGGSSPRVDRCTVYVFRLPDMGPRTAPFTSASFTFHYAAKQGILRANDLYGLGRRNDPDALAGDYYGKTSVPDPSASILQAGILDHQSPFGTVRTSESADLALRDYLNEQYASGAGAGAYVFLRLNSAGYNDSIDRATLTMSDGATIAPVDTRPRISFTTLEPTARQQWRTLHFGSPFNEGDGADDADPDSDGESNFFEFSTAQDPQAGGLSRPSLNFNGVAWEFLYRRNPAAVEDGIVFAVEWSDTLEPGSWSREGILESSIIDDGPVQRVTAEVPDGGTKARFFRLAVSTR